MKGKKLLSAILVGAMLLSTTGFVAFAEESEDPTLIEISNVAELKEFAANVNAGTTYAGKTVKLTDDIDLQGEEWTPIGRSGNTFQGIFDGDGHTISNLKAGNGWTSDVGFFGFTEKGAVKNFNINNADITGYLDVGVVAGTPYTSTYSNITVSGDITVNGYAYVGGAFGKNAYADITNVNVLANPGSYVKAKSEKYRTYIGGLVGFMGEGNITIADCNVRIDVSGSTCDIGGLLGILHYGNTLKNCSYEGSITLDNNLSNLDPGDETKFGALVGVAHDELGQKNYISGCSATITSATLCGEDVTESIRSFGNYYNRTPEGIKHLYDATVNGVKTIYSNGIEQSEIDECIGNGNYLDGNTVKSAQSVKDNENLTDSEKVAIIDKIIIKDDASDVAEIVKSLATEEKEKISAGKMEQIIDKTTSATLVAKDNETDPVIVAKSVSDGVATLSVTKLDSSETLQQPESVKALYFDVSLKDAANNHIKEVDVPVLVTVSVKDSSKAEKVIRYHDGVAAEMPFTVIDEEHISLTVAKFSDFAVILGQNVPAGSAVLGFKEVSATEPFTAKYDLYISADNEAVIKDFKSGEFSFSKTGTSGMEFAAAEGFDVAYEETAAKYRVNRNSANASSEAPVVVIDGKPSVKLATLIVTGVGSGSFQTDNIKMYRKSANDNLAVEITTLPSAIMNYNIETAKARLTVNIDFPNAVSNNESAYQAMSVNVKGGNIDNTYKLGSDSSSVVSYTNSKYQLVLDGILQQNETYTITVSGAGYRSARYTVNMTGDKTLNFWNNVKSAADFIENGMGTPKTSNFLAGDIVRDNIINLYDLSAVVSYFGVSGLSAANHPEYAQYDLNRDGKIDSKDVAYVLVSWDN